MRLLFVEDDLRLAELTAKGLSAGGYRVDHATSIDEAEAAVRAGRFDVGILDLGLPDGDGLDFIRNMRTKNTKFPFLILTARDGIGDRVKGLDAGADDYLLKPFALDELLARLRAILRRPGELLGDRLTAGNIVLDTVYRETLIDGRKITMTRRETSILEMLMRRVAGVVPKDLLEQSLYGFDNTGSLNSVEVAVHRLRRRLGQSGADHHIETVRGVGYVMMALETAK